MTATRLLLHAISRQGPFRGGGAGSRTRVRKCSAMTSTRHSRLSDLVPHQASRRAIRGTSPLFISPLTPGARVRDQPVQLRSAMSTGKLIEPRLKGFSGRESVGNRVIVRSSCTRSIYAVTSAGGRAIDHVATHVETIRPRTEANREAASTVCSAPHSVNTPLRAPRE